MKYLSKKEILFLLFDIKNRKKICCLIFRNLNNVLTSKKKTLKFLGFKAQISSFERVSVEHVKSSQPLI